MLGQDRRHASAEVFDPVSQRAQSVRESVQAGEQIRTQATGVAEPLKGLMRGRHEAHVDVYGRRRPHRHDLPLLQYAKNRDLRGGRKVCDLVQK